MSLAEKTARGAAWTILSSFGARIIGVSGTLIMTRFLEPDIVGEVSAATIICMTANWMSIWGFAQYVIVKGRGDDAHEVTFHTTVAHLVLGTLALGAIAMFGGRFAPYVDAPEAAKYVPGMALAIFLRRIGSVPEKILVRRMQFRAIAVAATVGELSYTIVAVVLATRGWGGQSIIVGNLVQSTLMTAILIQAAGVREWTQPVRLRWARFKDMVRFGVPLAVDAVAHNASRYWDNLLVSRYFGPGPTGLYNMAYNLADIPAIQIGEGIAQVLLPSFSRLAADRRPAALERATALLSVIIFPLAVGLGLVAQPLIRVALAHDWQGVAPLLTVLAVLSVFRPITWVIGTYLAAQEQTRRLMFLEVIKLGILLGAIKLLAPWGIEWSAAGVGFAFGFHAIAGSWLVARAPGGPSPWRLFRGFMQPLAACAVMGGAVIGARHGLDAIGVERAWIELVVEIVVGALAYVVAVLVLARNTSHDLISLGRRLMKRGKQTDTQTVDDVA